MLKIKVTKNFTFRLRILTSSLPMKTEGKREINIPMRVNKRPARKITRLGPLCLTWRNNLSERGSRMRLSMFFQMPFTDSKIRGGTIKEINRMAMIARRLPTEKQGFYGDLVEVMERLDRNDSAVYDIREERVAVLRMAYMAWKSGEFGGIS